MKDKRILTITGIVLLFLMSVGLSYAYFTTTVSGNENAKDVIVQAGTLSLKYIDGPEITAKNVQPGWTMTKSVSVKNTGTLDAIYNLKWKELTNTIKSDELVFDLNCESSTDTCSYINLENQSVPSSPDLIMGDIIIYPGEIQTLSLTFTFKELNKDQNYNQGKKFNGVLNIEETTTTNDNEYTMYAQVINTNNEPMANTTIELQNESKTGTTDDSGYVMIDAIKPGSHTVLVKDSSGNVLDTRRVSIQQKKESDVIDSKVIYADITLPQFTTTIVLNDSNKIEEMSNLITPPDSCFNVNSGSINNYSYGDKCPKELIVPSEINGEKIIEITGYLYEMGSVSGGFYNNDIRKIVLPNSLTSIGMFAFLNNKLTNITIPEGVTIIGNRAFENNQLTNITIPKSVTSIGSYAFANNQLSSLSVPSSVTSIGFGAFNNNKLSDDQAFVYGRNDDGSEDKTTIISYGGANKNPIIPNGVKIIGESAFSKIQLKSVVIPNSITEINQSAFTDNQLTNVTIPEGVTLIGNSAFQNNQLANVIIPSSVTSMGYSVFENNQLTNVIIPSGVTSIEGYAFNNNQLKSITIPNSVTSIGYYAFANNQLTDLIIPTGVTTIDRHAFTNNQLTNVVIPNSVTSIGYFAFANNQLTNVIIPSNLTTIQDSLFANNQLTSVTIPSSVTSIYPSAFNGNKLTSVIFSDGIVSIGSYAFANNQLSSLSVPSSVTSIGFGAFNNNKLPDEQAFIYGRNSDGSENKTIISSYGGINKNPIIPEDVTTINNNAFYYCQLTSVTIPKSVTSIGSNAFAANKLNSVKIKGKTKSSEFTKYYPGWGWETGVTCVKDNTSNVTNGCITWGAS